VSFVQRVTSPRPGKGYFLAVPAYEGITAPFVTSLHSSLCNLPHRLDLEVFSGNVHIDDSRNRLVRDFLESDCDELIFLDADVTWLDCDLKKLIEHDRDIVAGIYPLKNDDEDYPVAPLPGERWAEADGCVEVAGVPTGFLKIRRRVFEKLYGTVPQHRSKEDGYGRMLIPVLFERSLNGLSRRGGDYEFCRKAREAGFKICVDPSMQLGHVGQKLWQGCLGHFWRKDIAIPEGIKAIREKRADAATFLEMFNVWANSWALSPEGLFASSVLARSAKGPILECGSGLSTLCLAAATDQPVYALESSAAWASRVDRLARDNALTNVRVHLTEVKDYGGFEWYADAPRENYGLVLCDGPPRKTGRNGLFRLLPGEIAGAPILVDDIVHVQTRNAVDEYCASAGRKLAVFEASRPFGIVQ
jgi:hypothetical protein